MVAESSPTLHAESPIALACTRSLTIGGFDLEDTGGTLLSACGCGHPLAARSVVSLFESFKAPVRYRMAQ
jgi:hypothetical protein